MRSWAQGEVRVCELFMNATLPGLVVGRTGGGPSVALGLLAAGRGRRGRVGRHGSEKSAEGSSADMACSPMVGEFGWERRRVLPVLLGQGVATVARARSAHALVTKWLRRAGEG